MRRRRYFLFDADPDTGGGGGTPAPAPVVSLPATIQQGLQNLINRQGSPDSAAILLYQENHEYRQKLREAEARIKKLESWLPKEGDVTLTGKEVEQWNAYQALGDPDTVKKLQGENEQLKGELGALRKEGTLRDVAETAGYKLQVLKTLGADLDYEIKEVDQDGKKAKGVFVKNGDGQVKPLGEYAKEKWPDFLPALQAEAPAQPTGTRFPPQNPGSPPPQKNVVEDFITEAQKARDAKTNPLVSNPRS